jgi:hypothetical protein
MAKYKPAGSKKTTAEKSNWSALPCLFLILLGIALVTYLFYEVLKIN